MAQEYVYSLTQASDLKALQLCIRSEEFRKKRIWMIEIIFFNQ